MLVQVLSQLKFYFPSFNLFLVFCSFFDSTGWAIKKNERIVLFKLCCYHCKNYSRKNWIVNVYHKILYLMFSWVFGGQIYALIFHMYSYTFAFKIFGFIRVFLLVPVNKKMYKNHSSFWNRFYLLLAFIMHLHVRTFVVHHKWNFR